jgi:hypothetical protein
VTVDDFLCCQGCLVAHHILHEQASVTPRVTVIFANSLWTPPRYNASEPDLLRIVSDVWSKTKNGAAKVPVWAFHNSRLRHVGFEWREDQLETAVIKLTTEELKFRPFSLASGRLKMGPSAV